MKNLFSILRLAISFICLSVLYVCNILVYFIELSLYIGFIISSSILLLSSCAINSIKLFVSVIIPTILEFSMHLYNGFVGILPLLSLLILFNNNIVFS